MTTETSRLAAKRASLFLLLHAGFGAILLALLLVVAPKVERILREFNTKMPAETNFVIDASHIVSRFGIVFVPLVAVCDFAVLHALYRYRSDRAARAYGYLALAAEMLIIAAVMIALIGPFIVVITPLSGGR